MFRRKSNGDASIPETEGAADGANPSPKPGLRPSPSAGLTPSMPPTLPPRVPNMPARSVGGELGRPVELPRRPSDLVGGMPNLQPVRAEAETRQLIVGREISLSGEITACDRLVVEGSVEANLANCHDIDIAESGLFKGSASIEEAEIRGRFEGTLTVRKRLLIRSTGKVVGTIRYGQIEIECGGQISGTIEAGGAPDRVANGEAVRERAPQPVTEVGAARVN